MLVGRLHHITSAVLLVEVLHRSHGGETLIKNEFDVLVACLTCRWIRGPKVLRAGIIPNTELMAVGIESRGAFDLGTFCALGRQSRHLANQ